MWRRIDQIVNSDSMKRGWIYNGGLELLNIYVYLALEFLIISKYNL